MDLSSYKSKIPSPGNQNLIDDKSFELNEGRYKTGTYYFNNPQIKSRNAFFQEYIDFFYLKIYISDK